MTEAQIATSILAPILISLTVGLLYSKIYERKCKSVIENLNNDHIVVRLPKALFWIGCLGTMVFATAIVLMTLFPNDTASLWVYILFSAFILLGIYLMAIGIIWKVEIFKQEDYFIYRSIFFRTYKIRYADCISYKCTNNTVELITKNRTLHIDTIATNFEFFMAMLKKNKIKELKDPWEENTRGGFGS